MGAAGTPLYQEGMCSSPIDEVIECALLELQNLAPTIFVRDTHKAPKFPNCNLGLSLSQLAVNERVILFFLPCGLPPA